jgi:low temperature requirement protein LtrA
MKVPLPFRPVVLRNDEGHRQASWLELFMDLSFVICIAGLTTMLVKDHTLSGLLLYAGLLFSVFWAWNQFTWYSILFDNNDVFYRIMYLGAILSVLVLADSFSKIGRGNTIPFVGSYVLLQSILAAGWIRIAISSRKFRMFSIHYLLGPVIGSALWLVSLKFPAPQQYLFWLAAMAIHVAAPYMAFKLKTFEIPLNMNHVLERYCLFTIIVLGETLIAVSAGIGFALGSDTFLIALFAYITIGCIWWTYFSWDFDNILQFGSLRNLFLFGYGHFVVFLAIASFGAGGEIAVHSLSHGGHLTLVGKMLIAISPSVYLISLSVINRFSWNMAFDRKMVARVVVAMLSLTFAIAMSDAWPVYLMGGIALLMVCLVIYEQVFCRALEEICANKTLEATP